MKYARDPVAKLDRLLVRKALKEIAQLRRKYREVVAIPEVVTIQDIAEYPVDTTAGPKKLKTLYPREIACRVLETFDGKDFISADELAFTVAICIAETFKERDVQ